MMGEYDAGYENCINAKVKQMENMQYRIDCLHKENAKLRELVLHFYKIAVRHCFTCPYEPTRECDGCEIADGERCMRELGVEVD